MQIQNGLGWTFDTGAENYEKMRPGYAAELYKDIFRVVSLNEESEAMEVGIGGGQATLPILKTGCKVTAVEYGENLAEVCRRKFRDFSSFSVVTGKFEDFSSAGHSYDLVYSATAFHWIPKEIGYPKVFELLKSGGVFARFANHPFVAREESRFRDAVQELYAKYRPGSRPGKEFVEEDAKMLASVAEKYGFVDISYRLYHRTRTFTAKEYTALLGTYSDHIAMEEKVREEFFLEIEKTIERFGGTISVYDTMDLELARKP